MSLRPTVDFLLYDWLGVQTLGERERFAEHNRETFDAVPYMQAFGRLVASGGQPGPDLRHAARRGVLNTHGDKT